VHVRAGTKGEGIPTLTVGDLEIKADVFRPDDNRPRPVLLWIHGGALIRGYRSDVNAQIKAEFLNAGYAIVSIDYRLAPETKLPQILEDLRDAYTWLHDKGPQLFHVDTSRIGRRRFGSSHHDFAARRILTAGRSCKTSTPPSNRRGIVKAVR
jgi:acetyl esterase/lipase